MLTTEGWRLELPVAGNSLVRPATGNWMGHARGTKVNSKGAGDLFEFWVSRVLFWSTTIYLAVLAFFAVKRIRALASLSAFLDKADFESPSFLEDLDHRFSKEPHDIQSSWQTFRHSLIVKGPYVRRTCEAVEHFNGADLVEPVLMLDLSKHVPGILTGVGIICTFTGMKSGLASASSSLKVSQAPSVTATPGIDVSSAQERVLTTMTQNLLEKIEPAIALSLLAVMCAIGFLFAERILYSICVSQLQRLQRVLDRKFLKVSDGALLQRVLDSSETIRDHSEQSMNSLKGVNTDFASMLENAMSKAMQPLMSTQTQHLERSQVALTGSVDRMGKSLEEAITKIHHEASNASGDTLNGLIEKFQNSLVSGANSQIQDMLSSISGVKDILAEQKGAQASFVKTIADASSTLKNEVLKQVQSFPSLVTTEVVKHQKELAESSALVLAKIGEDVGSQLLKSQEHQNDTLKKMREHFDASLVSLSGKIEEGAISQVTALQKLVRSMESLSTNLTRTSEQVFEKATAATSESLSALSGFVSKLTEDMEKHQRLHSDRSIESLEQISKAVGEQMFRSQGHHHKVLEEMRDYFDDSLRTVSTQVVESSNASLTGFQGLLESVEKISSATSKATQQAFEQGSQATAASIESISKALLITSKTHNSELLDTMRQFRTGFEASLERLSNQVKESANTSMQTTGDLARVAQTLAAHVESSTQAMAAQIQAGTSDSLASVTQNLQDLTKQQFGDVQVTFQKTLESLATGTQALLAESRLESDKINAKIGVLVSRLDSFGSSTHTNNEKFAATVHQVTQDIEKLLGTVESPISRMKALSETFLRQTEQLETLGLQLGTASQTLHSCAGELKEGLDESKASRLQTERAMSLAVTLGKSVDEYQRGVAQVTEETRAQVGELRKFVQDFHDNSATAFAQMKMDAASYQVAFHDGAQKFLGEVDRNLGLGTGKLSGAIEELADVLEDLQDLTRAAKR